MNQRALAFAFFALTLVGLGSRARAQDLERARSRFEEGVTQFNGENYALALVAFQDAYEMLEGHPRRALVLFNIGRCQEELDRLPEARRSYAQYLREAGEDAENRAEVEQRLRELETRMQLESGPAEEQAEDATSASPRSAAQSTDALPARDDGLLLGGIVVAVVGGVGLAGFAVLGGLALGEYSKLQNSCGASRTCTRQQVATLSTFDTSADIALTVGLLGAAAAAVLFPLWATSGSEGESTGLSFWGGPTGGGVWLRERF